MLFMFRKKNTTTSSFFLFFSFFLNFSPILFYIESKFFNLAFSLHRPSHHFSSLYYEKA